MENGTNRLEWIKLKEDIYFEDGSWRDLYVLNANMEDWKRWVDYVNQNYRIEWYDVKTETTKNQIDYDVINQYFTEAKSLGSLARIFIDKIIINCHFFCETIIENDIDPSEIKSFEDHQKILIYMTDIANILDKEVRLTLENMEEIIFIKC